MIERLNATDSSFLYLEDASAAAHVGQVMLFAAPPDFRSTVVRERIEARLEHLPRFRQRVQSRAGRLMTPVWVDDADFDIDYHVRRSALPSPGSPDQLCDFVARVCAKPLDRSRPLWETYVVEGLSQGGVGIVTKVHQALVDAGDITGLSADPRARVAGGGSWVAAPGPSTRQLLTDTVTGLVRSPAHVVGTVRTGVRELRSTASQVARLGSTLVRAAVDPPSSRPFAIQPTSARRYLMVDAQLADYREIRDLVARSTGARASLHAIALTIITGALRSWLQSRGDAVTQGRSVRALVPVSITDDSHPSGASVEAVFVELPVGETSPLVRLHQISFSLEHQLREHRGVQADELAAMAGFAPPALHSLGIRLGASLSNRLFNLVITNVPGPQRPMYSDGMPLLATYPVLPLTKGHAVALGMTSYNGRIHHGILADRDSVPDLEVLGSALEEAVEEMRDWMATVIEEAT